MGDAPSLPKLPNYTAECSTDAQIAEELATYILKLLAIPEVFSSRQFLSLLNDHDGAGGAESSGIVPVGGTLTIPSIDTWFLICFSPDLTGECG